LPVISPAEDSRTIVSIVLSESCLSMTSISQQRGLVDTVGEEIAGLFGRKDAAGERGNGWHKYRVGTKILLVQRDSWCYKTISAKELLILLNY
jgi:hypothetical protein